VPEVILDILLIVDVQNDFCPGGALAVPEGDRIMPEISKLMAAHQHVIVTQDWHSADHSSFASQHPGRAPFETVAAPYGAQVLWPDHCIQGTPGAEFHPDLDWTRAELLIRKGFRRDIDSYSAFFENDHRTPTGLGGYLRERGFTRVVLAGLATDFCVHYSAMDARKLGFEATVIERACRAIDLGGSLAQARRQWAEAGVRVA
jgi:nicotinamidase/pyrazinamidase